MSGTEGATPAPEATGSNSSTPALEATATSPALEASDTPAPEATPNADPEPFDAAKALERVRKATAEAKAMRERAKLAEEKVVTLEATAAETATLKQRLMRTEVALELGLPMTIAKRLQGDTAEAMRADAEELLTQMQPKGPARAGSTRPVESLQTGSGKANGSGPVQLTQQELDRMKPDAIVAAKAAGQLNDLLGVPHSS